MNFKARLEKAGATPAKLALIGVLSVVLIVVIVVQLPESNESTRSHLQQGEYSSIAAGSTTLCLS